MARKWPLLLISFLGLLAMAAEACLAAEAKPPVMLGIDVCEAESPEARRLGVNVRDGAVISKVYPGYAAQIAGLQAGDVVVACGDRRIARCEDLHEVVRGSAAGNRHRLTLFRGANVVAAEITLGATAGEEATTPPAEVPPAGELADDVPSEFYVGMQLRSAGHPDAVAAEIESPLGTAILGVTPGGPAAHAGLRRGDLIVEFSGHEIETFEDFEAALEQCTPRTSQPITVVRGTQRLSLWIPMATRPVTVPPLWYEHPEGNFRLRFPGRWWFERPAQPELPPDRQYDRIESGEKGYLLLVFRSGWDTDHPEQALEEFVSERSSGVADAVVGRFKMGDAPAAWVAYQAGNSERRMFYRISFVHGGRRYVINALAPPLSDPGKLPLPLEHALSSVSFRPREGSGTGQAPEVATTSPPPVAPPKPADNVPPAESPPEYPPDVAVLLTPSTWTVRPSSDPQVIRCNPRLEITIPGGLLKREEELTVAAVPEAKIPHDSVLDFQTLACWDIRLGEMHEFDPPLLVEVPYDPALLNPDAPAAEQILAFRWDETRRRWVMLPVRVDEARRTIIAEANHLSRMRILTIRVPGLDWLTWKKLALVPVVVLGGHTVYEELFLDVHLSPHCLVLYQKKAIEKSSLLNDTAWKNRGGGGEWITLGPRRTSRVKWVKDNWFAKDQTFEGYRPGVPLYVQDLAHFVDVAYDRYKGLNYKVPSGPVLVKLDSNYISLFGSASGAAGMFDKIFDRIHICTRLCDTPESLKKTAAHELFHAVQHEDYRGFSMTTFSTYLWWLEAGAEYAACREAYTIDRMAGKSNPNGVNPRMFEKPLSATGEARPYDDHEYERAYFLDYLVSRNAQFHALHTAVAAYDGHSHAIFAPLHRALRDGTGVSLSDHYRGFVNHFLFSKTSPVAALVPDQRSTEMTSTVRMPSSPTSPPPPVEHSFTLPKEYTAKVWGVNLEPDPARPSEPRSVFVESVKQSPTVHVELYVLKENRRVDGTLKPSRILVKQGDAWPLTATADDRIYVVAINTSETEDGQATVRIKDAAVQLEIDPPSIADNTGNRVFTLKGTARRLGPPVESVAYQWDFGDGTPVELQRYNGALAPEINFSQIHTFAKEGDMTVTLELYDTTASRKILLARATAKVQLGSEISLVLDPPITVAEAKNPVPFEVRASKAPDQPVYVWTFSGPDKVVTTTVPTANHTFDTEGDWPIRVELFDAANRKTALAKATGKAAIIKPVPMSPQLAALHKCKHLRVSIYVEKAAQETRYTGGERSGSSQTEQRSLGLVGKVSPVEWSGRTFRVSGIDDARGQQKVTITGYFSEDLTRIVNLSFTAHRDTWHKGKAQKPSGEWYDIMLGGTSEAAFNLHDVPFGPMQQEGWYRGMVKGKEARALVTGVQWSGNHKDYLFNSETRWHSLEWGDRSDLVVVFSETPTSQ